MYKKFHHHLVSQGVYVYVYVYDYVYVYHTHHLHVTAICPGQLLGVASLVDISGVLPYNKTN